MRYVIDASVALKALLLEPGSAVAQMLFDAHRGGSISLHAPDLIIAEVANALWKRVAVKNQLTEAEAQDILDDFWHLASS